MTVRPRDYIAASLEGLRIQTTAHAGAWRLGEEERWDLDLEAGVVTFTFVDGLVATAPIQLVGTFNSGDGTFLWAWDHPSAPLSLRRAAGKVRAWAQRHAVSRLLRRKIRCSEDDAWGYTALAARLSKANGAYRALAGEGGPYVFFTFGAVSLRGGSRPPEVLPAVSTSYELRRVKALGIIDFVRQFMRDTFEIEKAFHDKYGSRFPARASGRAIQDKRAIYERYWRRDDDYWQPCSMGWPSDDDLSRTRRWEAFRISRGCYRINYRITNESSFRDCAYVVQRFPDGLRIVDHLF